MYNEILIFTNNYHIAQNSGRVYFCESIIQSFGKENIEEFTKVNLSYFSQSAIWLLVNDARCAKFVNAQPQQNFTLYSIFVTHTHV